MAPASESLKQTIYDALTRTINQCNECLMRISELENNLKLTDAELRKAQAAREAADYAHTQARNKYRELVDYRNSLTDSADRSALDPEIELLALSEATAGRQAEIPVKAVSRCQQALTGIEQDLGKVKLSLKAASERRDLIARQLQKLTES